MIKAVIVDDEALARLRIRRLLLEAGGVEVLAELQNGAQLYAFLQQQTPDLLLLDIEMPETDIFQLLLQLPKPVPNVIFTTAHPQHALTAFDSHAIDYLLKPLSLARLQQALLKIRQTQPDIEKTPAQYARRMALPIGRRMQMVEVSRINQINAQANYVEIKADGRDFLLRKPLSWLLTQLDPKQFLQIHRSHIVRIDAVVECLALSSARYRLRLHNGCQLISGRHYHHAVRCALNLKQKSV